MNLEPNTKEVRALRQFVCPDTTRSHMATLWQYTSDGGCTHMATDGHTIAIRRAGTHRTMPLHEIVKLAPLALDEVGKNSGPPRWDTVMRRPAAGKLADAYGINPDYVARVGGVERAAGQRAADDYQQKPGESAKSLRNARAHKKNSQCAVWSIPADALDGWHWSLDTDAARWEGIIMPRRV